MKPLRTPLHPVGILLAHVLPATLLLFIYGSMVQVIAPILGDESLAKWSFYGWALLASVIASAAYAAIAWRMRKNVGVIYAALVFLCYVPLIYTFMNGYRELVPWEVPRWMMPADAELFAMRLLSIPLAHALFVLVTNSLPANSRGTPLRDILIAAAIPLCIYILIQVVEPLRWDVEFEEHTWVVLGATMVTAFLFFLFRGLMALVQRRTGTNKGLLVVVTVLVALVFPLLGLLIHNGAFVMEREVVGIFGDLSHPAFYVIAVLNAAALLWPSSNSPRIRYVQFILRGIGFTYVLYFFVLFLPLLPLSIVAVIAIGIGFLLLAPVMLFIAQAMQLLKDARFLVATRSRASVVLSLVAAMLVLPAIITVRYAMQRHVLHSALAHIYQSDPNDNSTRIDTSALANVLDQVTANRSGRGSWTEHSTPFLTPYYNWLVLDNLSISDDKLATLRAVFMNEGAGEGSAVDLSPPSFGVLLDSTSVVSTYDEKQQAWRSWVHLRMRNTSDRQAEFVDHFNLPDGAWISDNYLVIGTDTVKGILAEKKAAMWVYNNIVSYRRDPSMMRYTAPSRVQMRVFPFAPSETRWAGFEVLHKEAFLLSTSKDTLLLGDRFHVLPEKAISTSDGAITYIPSTVKAKLPLVKRTPHYHFIVDGTEARRATREEAISRIDAYITREKLDPARISLHIGDAYGANIPWNAEGKDRYMHHAGEGGFFSDRIIRGIIGEACAHPTGDVPVIIIARSQLTDRHEGHGIWLNDLSDVTACLPEGDHYFVLEEDLRIEPHSFNAPDRVMGEDVVVGTVPDVCAWPDAAKPKAYFNPQASTAIVVEPDRLGEMDEAPVRSWNSALELEGRSRAHQLRPQGGTNAWRELVRGSFKAQVLLPVTAWMCLEDDAQRNALLKKQDEMLSGNAALDASDQNITSMSEPNMIWLIVPLLLWFALRRRSSN